MTKNEKIIYIQKYLLAWYKSNGRKFSWREDNLSNYEIIISEILLQRTKAETVSNFYFKYFTTYPNWEKLWKASEQEIQDFLKPLGLNVQRGTRLYKLAQEIKKRKGILPLTTNEVSELDMFGQYITNAYELLILKKHSPLLDVNMARFLERLFGKRKLSDIRYDSKLKMLAHKIVDHSDSKIINWAILDYAALICKSRNPKCISCSLKIRCKYFNKTDI